ncbi:MAG TPA: hypothetical protein VFR35_19325, partial [Actinoplanes sp.]|nr:hypothetical protein [Actinoplanes sp.]
MAQAEQPDSYDEELARIDASIADLKIRDMAAANERMQIASKIQAAQFQRDILAHATAQRKAKTARTRRVRRPQAEPPPPPPPPHPPRRSEQPPEWAAPGTPYTGPPGIATDGATLLVDDPPPSERPAAPPRRAHHTPAHPPHPPEASTQSVQNIMLALGALVLGVAAVVFAGLAPNPFAGAAILALATAGALTLAPGISHRGLSSTAETVAAVGLVLLPMTLYALHDTAVAVRVPVQVFLGVALAITAVAGFLYAGVTRLSAPRYATVIAVQPVPPLLAYPVVESPAGWGMALAVVALIDLLLLTTVIRRGRLVPRWPIGRPVAGDREGLARADARDVGARDFERSAAGQGDLLEQEVSDSDPEFTPDRPESHPEEPDLIIESLAPPRRRWLPTRIFPGRRPEGAPPAGTVPLYPPASPPSADWLRELTFALLCVAVAGSLLYAGGALIGAEVVIDALRSGLILVLAGVIASAAARLLGHLTARNIAGAVLTLTVISASARITAVADPRWTLVVAAGAVACTGAVIGMVPPEVRRGPQLASAAALTLIGLFIAFDALRAAMAPVQAARPVWNADTAAYADRIADAAGPSGWLLAVSALLLTFAAALALPAEYRHEGAVVGVALTALAVPASLGLPWSEAPWPLVLASIGLGAAGLMARTRRIAATHVA